MTVTDPDVPDPLNDPRTLQADPGAYGQGGDLASTEDDAVSTGEDELTEDDAVSTGEDELTEDDLTAGRDAADDAGGGDVTGGAFSDAPRG
ncbi:hypothetical protein [Geodermatophilus obscurus]|uniref:Uncharacterized protein n=1 Tax=Geodermatophilus obscurus (strain ATCC 25078 / DSM 43160 / JCM 3152 / CCUG 61914 / KCC A-0152 / KCTC 9177 / NBRC 13315 / NRRL B-3577 / G-20) TaxID=526225 RepID=D2S6R9_GEOOG|nr:hypothetical protein [Geodermatophilus obscurus]ADB77411.1 conserved hypothetical protein [Geodermatophilus obscurus DSM 43160]